MSDLAHEHLPRESALAPPSEVKPENIRNASRNRLGWRLQQSLCQIMRWYRAMVDDTTHRLLYEYNPVTGQISREKCPIRDIASVCDVITLSRFLNDNSLVPLIDHWVDHYRGMLMPFYTSQSSSLSCAPEAVLIMDPKKMDESSNIAHSAFMILLLIEHAQLKLEQATRKSRQLPALSATPQLSQTSAQSALATHTCDIQRLADGIAAQQRPSGSYKIFFDPTYKDNGVEFYAGEAMLALTEAHSYLALHGTHAVDYMSSVARAFPFYEHYWRGGYVPDDLLIFFANWQTQALTKFYDYLIHNTEGAEEITIAGAKHNEKTPSAMRVAEFICSLYDIIVFEKRYFEGMRQFPRRYATVEVACGLEGLADTLHVVREVLAKADRAADVWERRQQGYFAAVEQASEFLLLIQSSTYPGDERGVGGFGHGIGHMKQRVDVTGHVVRAFHKLLRYRLV